MRKYFVIINYIGNLKSVENAFKNRGAEVYVTDSIRKIKNATGIVLPGVGAFGAGMKNLEKHNLIDLIIKEIEKGKPFLGICLGLQLLFEKSEETPDVKGLSIFKGEVKKFKIKDLKIPHLGWNQIEIKKRSPLLKGIKNKSFFYFVHSYFVEPEEKDIIMCTTNYGKEFVTGVWKENVFGVQFHPEKSQDNGLKLIENFIEFAKLEG